jgi:2-C-methyl-D-erythritol 4-phosphate cytidylyltransferase
MAVQALIQAAGDGSRLGRGPKAFVMLGGRTLLERAIAIFRGVADGVIVAVQPGEMTRARALVGSDGVALIAGGASRSETTRRLVAAATAPWLLLHDVVHPFATPDLARSVLAAARAHRAAAPGVANTEFLYDREGRPLHAPGDVLVGQKPVAFAREAVEAAYAVGGAAAGDPSLLEILERAGIRTMFVEGSASNIKITGPADLAAAEAMLAAGPPEGVRASAST